MWIIDFGDREHDAAALFISPFEYVKKHVKPDRENNNRARRRNYWWQHGETMPGLRKHVKVLSRFVCTPRVSKPRVFIWVSHSTLPDSRVYAFARDDDYFFGVLHSRIHEIWSLTTSSRHGVAGDIVYNNTTCFETFPFPWPLGQESVDDARVIAIGHAATNLVDLRKKLKTTASRYDTLTKMYNEKPEALMIAHRKLDEAVFAAYGWPSDLSEDEILARLLALNLEWANRG